MSELSKPELESAKKADEALNALRELMEPSLQFNESLGNMTNAVNSLEQRLEDLFAEIKIVQSLLKGYTEESLAIQKEKKQLLAKATLAIETTLKNL